MRRKLQAGLVSTLLLIGISCSKEPTSNSSVSSVQVSNESESAELQSAINESNPLVVKGDWTFYYDWFCPGTYSLTTMKLKKDGTFLTGFGERGKWISGNGIVAFHYHGLSTTYSGKIKKGQITGIMAEYRVPISQGCFYMTKGVAKGFKGEHIPGLPYSGKSPSASTETSGEVESDELQSTDDASDPLVFKGDWTFYFDWGCTGSYSSTTMHVKNDGTWTNGQGNNGQWITGNGIFAFHFDGYNTTYSGKTRHGEISGIMGEFQASNAQGCFYMTKGIAKGFKDEHIAGQPYANGKR